MIEQVSVTQLRRRTKYYVDRVVAGETFAITRYGKVVAYIVPYERWVASK